MKIRNTLTKLIAITIAVTALVGTALLQPVSAQIGAGSVKFISHAALGIVPGEKIRLSVGNEGSPGDVSVRVSYYLAHGTNSLNGVPVYESELIQVPPGEFRYVDVSHQDLKIAGEPLTGRAQLLVGVSMMVPAGTRQEDLPWSLEVIADQPQDGNTVQTDSKYRLIIVAAQRSKQLRLSFVPGQSLRYTILNSKEEPVRVHAYGYDHAGRLLIQTDPVVLQPGESYTAIINRDDLFVAGEKGTGRVQMATGVQAAFMDGSVRHVNLPVWVELVENRTGSTSGGDYYTGTVTISGDGF